MTIPTSYLDAWPGGSSGRAFGRGLVAGAVRRPARRRPRRAGRLYGAASVTGMPARSAGVARVPRNMTHDSPAAATVMTPAST